MGLVVQHREVPAAGESPQLAPPPLSASTAPLQIGTRSTDVVGKAEPGADGGRGCGRVPCRHLLGYVDALMMIQSPSISTTDQAKGRPFQVQPRPLRVRHTDTGPIAATTRPPAPISHQRVSGT